MPKQKTNEFKTWPHKLWFNCLLFVGGLALSYGFFSWAINNGNLLFWALGIFLLTWAPYRLILGFRYKLHKA